MRWLILGLSSLARRRVIPALGAVESVDTIDIGTTKPPEHRAGVTGEKLGTIYTGYDEALRASRADVVYVSLVNSLHEVWVEQALRCGKHVIVDKPAFLSLAAAERLCALASSSGLCLAEAIVYPSHPQVEYMLEVFRQNEDRPLRISTFFSFPPLDAGNFRYNAGLGGGALWDLGPYAVSLGRIFFGASPEDVLCRINSRRETVDTSFGTLLSFSGGRSLAGQFGFDTHYQNRITVTGSKVSVSSERIFTTPPSLGVEVVAAGGDKSETHRVAPADTFQCFFRDFTAALLAGDTDRFGKALLQDAAVLDKMRQNAGEKHDN